MEFCELIRSNLHSELQKLLVAYKLISREMVYRIENHEAPKLFTLQLALKDVHDKLQEMAPIEQNLIPIRRRLYRFQLHEERARRSCSPCSYYTLFTKGMQSFKGSISCGICTCIT